VPVVVPIPTQHPAIIVSLVTDGDVGALHYLVEHVASDTFAPWPKIPRCYAISSKCLI